VPDDNPFCHGRLILPLVRHLTEAQTLNVPAFRGVQMKFSVAAIILFSSIATSFAGNFAPIPKNSLKLNQFRTQQYRALL
jgi:hypothetical protein